MNTLKLFATVLMVTTLSAAGCGKEESAMDKAVEDTKDALNVREHEKLKDAAEDAQDAVEGAVEGIKDEVDGE